MNKKKIPVIIIFVVALILLGVGAIFMFGGSKEKNTLDPDTYVAEEHIFQEPDEVVTFLKNIYKSDNVEIVSNDGTICKIKAVDSEGNVFNYEYDIKNHLLDTVEDKTFEADVENEIDENPTEVSES